VINLAEITNRFQHALDHALTSEQLGHHAVHGVEVVEGYMEWFYHQSHPRMILPDMLVSVSRPPKHEVIDACAAEEDGGVCCDVQWCGDARVRGMTTFGRGIERGA